jgi:hypothetical protein
MTSETLTPAQARSEIARLGFVLEPDLECLGAEKRRGTWSFTFGLSQPAGTDTKILHCRRDDLPSLLATVAWINRPEPVFDLAQRSLTDPRAWRELQRRRREDLPYE